MKAAVNFILLREGGCPTGGKAVFYKGHEGQHLQLLRQSLRNRFQIQLFHFGPGPRGLSQKFQG